MMRSGPKGPPQPVVHSFLFCFSLQSGVIIYTAIIFVVRVTALLYNVSAANHYSSGIQLAFSYIILLLFAVANVVSLIFVSTGAFLFQARLTKFGNFFLLTTEIIWLLMSILAFIPQLPVYQFVCVDDRCPSTQWIFDEGNRNDLRDCPQSGTNQTGYPPDKGGRMLSDEDEDKNKEITAKPMVNAKTTTSTSGAEISRDHQSEHSTPSTMEYYFSTLKEFTAEMKTGEESGKEGIASTTASDSREITGKPTEETEPSVPPTSKEQSSTTESDNKEITEQSTEPSIPSTREDQSSTEQSTEPSIPSTREDQSSTEQETMTTTSATEMTTLESLTIGETTEELTEATEPSTPASTEEHSSTEESTTTEATTTTNPTTNTPRKYTFGVILTPKSCRTKYSIVMTYPPAVFKRKLGKSSESPGGQREIFLPSDLQRTQDVPKPWTGLVLESSTQTPNQNVSKTREPEEAEQRQFSGPGQGSGDNEIVYKTEATIGSLQKDGFSDSLRIPKDGSTSKDGPSTRRTLNQWILKISNDHPPGAPRTTQTPTVRTRPPLRGIPKLVYTDIPNALCYLYPLLCTTKPKTPFKPKLHQFTNNPFLESTSLIPNTSLENSTAKPDLAVWTTNRNDPLNRKMQRGNLRPNVTESQLQVRRNLSYPLRMVNFNDGSSEPRRCRYYIFNFLWTLTVMCSWIGFTAYGQYTILTFERYYLRIEGE